MRRILRLSVTVLTIVVSGVYLYVNRDSLGLLLEVRPRHLVIITALTFLTFVSSGVIFALLVRIVGVRLTAVETVGLSLVTSMGNYLGPLRPGAALKAVYLKSYRQLPYAHFMTVLSANAFLLLLMTGLSGLVVLSLIEPPDAVTGLLLFLVCLFLVAGSALPFVVRLPRVAGTGRLTSVLRSALEGFGIIGRAQGRLLLTCAVIVLQFLLSAVVYQYAYNAMGLSLSFASATAIGVFAAMSNFFTITPNNLAIQEAVVAYMITVAGFDFVTGAMGATLLRLVHVVLTFALAPLFMHLLMRRAPVALGRNPPGAPGHSRREPRKAI